MIVPLRLAVGTTKQPERDGEEEAMASWLADRISETTRTYLRREHADLDEAKR